MRYRFLTADVFTDRAFGGNPLAVFPKGDGLTGAQMQQIANEFNLSETVFALPPEDPAHTLRLRIFTPASEMPFAGHPTVGAAVVLAAIGALPLTGAETAIVFEEGVGPVPVTIQARDGAPVSATLTAAQLPESGPAPPSREALAEVLTLEPRDLLDGAFAPEGLSCGFPFLFVPLASVDAVSRARVHSAAWERHLGAAWARDLYVFAFEGELGGAALRARMFGVSVGIVEDPATGAAAVTLAGYLAARDPQPTGTLRWTVRQGVEMGRPSTLEIAADKHNGTLTALRVGGAAVLMSEGHLEV